MGLLANAWTKIVAIEKLILSNAWQFILPVLKKFEGDAQQILLSEAIPICQAVALSMSGADGGTKAAEAFKQIEADMVTKGIAAGKSDINWAIETAVQYIAAQTLAAQEAPKTA